MVDPLPAPTIQVVVMYMRQLQPPLREGMRQLQPPLCEGMYQLAEFSGDILLVEVTYRSENEGFKVLKEDLTRKAWVRVESIGDCMLMFHSESSISLLAADVGGRGNCIYVPGTKGFVPGHHRPTTWRMFDLETGVTTDGALPNAEPKFDQSQLRKYSMFWTMPSIC